MCNASGNPTPIIRWYHNDTLIIGQNGIELVLANATKINEGEYKCVAENIVTNTTSNEAFVEIKGNTVRTILMTTGEQLLLGRITFNFPSKCISY